MDPHRTSTNISTTALLFCLHKIREKFQNVPHFVQGGDGAFALVDPSDPTRYLNLFLAPKHEVILYKPRSSFFLNGPYEWLVEVECVKTL